jgi:ribose 5-phosphate isomerase A
MKSTGGSDRAKQRAGEAAAKTVRDGNVVGLGTGSTAAHAIRALGQAVDSGLKIKGIPTSYRSRQLASEAGISLTTLEEARPDVAIDGADQVTTDTLALIKGGGAAHTLEKVVDAAADRFFVVIDDSKLAETLDHPIPIETIPDAVPTVKARIAAIGGKPVLRIADCKDGPVVTSHGNFVLDCAFGPIAEPASLAATLSAFPGVVEHGLFVDIADVAVVGSEHGVQLLESE